MRGGRAVWGERALVGKVHNLMGGGWLPRAHAAPRAHTNVPPPSLSAPCPCPPQGTNELWLALVLTHKAVFGLTGPQLAGLLGAILSGEVLKRPGDNWVAYPASRKVVLL